VGPRNLSGHGVDCRPGRSAALEPLGLARRGGRKGTRHQRAYCLAGERAEAVCPLCETRTFKAGFSRTKER
jgi:hypothetical protein